MVKYSFIVAEGPDLGRTFELEPGITLIGRLTEPTANDPEGSRRWVFLDKTVSRTHSELSWKEPGAPLLTHLSQTNDTFIDGRRIKEESLQDGQAIRMGQTIMVVQMSQDYGWGDGDGRKPAKKSKSTKPKQPVILPPSWASGGGSGSGAASGSGSASDGWGEWESGDGQSFGLDPKAPTEKLSYNPADAPVGGPDFGPDPFAPESMGGAPSDEMAKPAPPRAADSVGDSQDSWAFLPSDTGGDPFSDSPAEEPSSDYRLRFAEPEDLAAITKMMRNKYKEAGSDFDMAKASQGITELLAHPHLGLLWLVLAGDELIGYLCLTFGFSLEFGGRDAFLDELYVKPAHRGQGLGTGAVVAALAEASERGLKAVHLEVDAENRSVRRIYKGQGFQVRDQYFLMTKNLSDT